MRSSFRLLELGTCLALGAVACAPAGGPPAAPPAEAAKYGGIFHYTDPGTSTAMDPNTFAGSTGWAGLWHVYDPLLGLDFQGPNIMELNLRPKLAESWKQDSETAYTFNLRRNVKWHDGQPFAAHDVVATYRRMLDSKELPGKMYLSGVTEVKATDDYTVKLATSEPNAALLRQLTYGAEVMSIVPKALLEAGADFNKTYVGTGPFKIVSHDPTVKTVYEKNSDYYVAGQPYLDGMVLFYGVEQNAQMAALVAGQTDVLHASDRKEFEPMQKQLGERMGYEILPGRSVNQVALRVDREPFNDVRVRKAVNLMVDRQALKQVVTFGEGVINPPLLPASRGKWVLPQEGLLQLPGYRQPKDADMAEARRLLAEAGFASGLKFGAIVRGASPVPAKILPVFAEQMRRGGIEVEQQVLESGIYTKRYTSGDYQAVVAPFGDLGELTGDLMRYHSKGAKNYFGINDPELDALIEKQRATMNEEERIKVVHQVQRLALDKALVVSTVDAPNFTMWRDWVHGYRNFSISSYKALSGAESLWMDKDQVPAR